MPGVKPMPHQLRCDFSDLDILSTWSSASLVLEEVWKARGRKNGASAHRFSGCADWKLWSEESDAGLVEP